jgi:catechol 2,3-dioxygenase-like lactoylglutathione lyase family enzyme
MQDVLESRPKLNLDLPISPARLARVVLRTSQFEAIVTWYTTVLGARTAFSNGSIAMLYYDDEHHRLAVMNVPDLSPQSEANAGVCHFTFTYASLQDLVATYERLQTFDIRPVACMNRGATTSMVYEDPDGNLVELNIDNYDTVEETGAFYFGAAFAKNPAGVPFEPRELLRQYYDGELERDLKIRADALP